MCLAELPTALIRPPGEGFHSLLHGILHDSKGEFSYRFDSSYQFALAGQKILAILRCASIMIPVVY